MRHIHLDPLGGAAGDMFVAAMLACFPEHRDAAIDAARRLAGVGCRLVDHDDGTLTGSRFEVDAPAARPEHDHGQRSAQGHGHVHWRALRARIAASDLPPPVREQAIGIFTVLAAAEARVHGVLPDAVTFHEVGAADSVADIVAAAWLIAAAGAASWSVASLPIGSGRVRTAHGPMPVPAPATALLLEGAAMHDDGVAGERVTPTGAAILRHLACFGAPRPPGVLRRSGFGFGTRRLPGMSNCLRALVFEAEAGPESGASTLQHRELAVINFEVDDQSGEELGAGLERIRAAAGVHDVIQIAAIGKKGRLAAHVQVLARPDALDAVSGLCFDETTTIGLRTHLVQGRALSRRLVEVPVDGQAMRVKLVDRPGGVTGKAESDDVLGLPGQASRSRRRREAEAIAETGIEAAGQGARE